jgi:hypothetical protein
MFAYNTEGLSSCTIGARKAGKHSLLIEGAMVAMVIMALLIPCQGASVIWGSSYSSVPNAFQSNSGVEVDYYYPTSNPNDASIWMTYKAVSTGAIYVQMVSTTISTSQIQITGA